MGSSDVKIPKAIKIDCNFASRMTVGERGRFALVSGALGSMYRLDFTTWKATPWTTLRSNPTAIALSPDESKVALAMFGEGEGHEHIDVRSVADGALIASMDARDPSQASGGIESLSWSPNGARIVSVSSSAVDKDAAHVVLFELAAEKVQHVRAGAHAQLAAAFVDDATVMIVSSRKVQPDEGPDTDLWLLDVATGALDRKGDGAMDVVKELQRTADGRVFATASYSAARVLERDGSVVFTAGEGGLAHFDGAAIVTVDSRKNIARTVAGQPPVSLGKAAKATTVLRSIDGRLLLLQEAQVQVLPLQ